LRVNEHGDGFADGVWLATGAVGLNRVILAGAHGIDFSTDRVFGSNAHFGLGVRVGLEGGHADELAVVAVGVHCGGQDLVVHADGDDITCGERARDFAREHDAVALALCHVDDVVAGDRVERDGHVVGRGQHAAVVVVGG
jgi:hypothetical protein